MQLRKTLFNVCLKSLDATSLYTWGYSPCCFLDGSPLSFLALEFYSGPRICKPLWSFREIFRTPAAHSMFLCTFLKDRESGAALEVQDIISPPVTHSPLNAPSFPPCWKHWIWAESSLLGGWVIGNRVDVIDSPPLLRPLLQSERQGETSFCIPRSCAN